MPKHKTTKAENKELNLIRKNIRRCILEEYRSIDAFCWHCDIPKSSLNDVLTGKSNPTYILLMRIRDVLGLKIENLIY